MSSCLRFAASCCSPGTRGLSVASLFDDNNLSTPLCTTRESFPAPITMDEYGSCKSELFLRSPCAESIYRFDDILDRHASLPQNAIQYLLSRFASRASFLKAGLSRELTASSIGIRILDPICSMHVCTYERAIESPITDLPTSGPVIPPDQQLSSNSNRSLLEAIDGSSPTSKGCLCRV